jgi:hypothetical protein
MTSIAASQIEEALSRARNIGTVTETFTIDGCEITLRNLHPEDYEAAHAATKDLEDIAYLLGHQREYLCRSICGLNGADFTDVRYIEVTEALQSGGTRVVKRELHEYICDTVVRTWSREVLNSAYRKLTDVLDKAEAKARENVTFNTPDETPDEKLRRLLGEVQETVGELPNELVDNILGESGYARRSTVQEVTAASTRLGHLADTTPAPASPPTPATVAPVPRSAPQAAEVAPLDPDEIMRNRQPLNRQAVAIPEKPKAAPVAVPTRATARTAEIAALEGLPETGIPAGAVQLQQGPTELAQHAPRVEPKEAAKLLDTPPAGGLNPRYRPPQR